LHQIHRLIDKYHEITASPRNMAAKNMWSQHRSIVLDKWRGCPKPYRELGTPPVVVWLGTDIMQEMTGMDVGRYYSEPAYFLECWLKSKIFHFETFNDDGYYDTQIPIWLGEGFEATLFGMPMCYSKTRDPWVDRSQPPILEDQPVNDLPYPTFASGGLMPLAIQFYEELKTMLNGTGLEPVFQNWGNGPMMTCNYLFGFENTAMSFYTNPDFIAALLMYIAQARIAWTKERANYLVEPISKGEILDDDVCVPNVSPDIYNQFIFPAEKRLSDFHNGISYWHCCGPAEPYMSKVIDLKNVDLVSSGPFSDHKQIAKSIGNQAAIEHHVKPQDEGVAATDKSLYQLFSDIKQMYNDSEVTAYTLRLTAYRNPSQSFKDDIERVKRWVEIAKETRA